MLIYFELSINQKIKKLKKQKNVMLKRYSNSSLPQVPSDRSFPLCSPTSCWRAVWGLNPLPDSSQNQWSPVWDTQLLNKNTVFTYSCVKSACQTQSLASYCCRTPGGCCLIWGLCERCFVCTDDPLPPAAAGTWARPACALAHTPPGTAARCRGNCNINKGL